MREFTLLRRVIMRVARENGLDDCPSEALTEMIGAAVESAVSSYVYSRDYQSRKVEAQHIGFVTHELRNPLTTAMVAGSQLGKVKGLPRDARRPLEIMTRSLQRLRKLIDQVLDVERLEAGEREAQPVPTSLTGILDVAVEHARSEAAARGVALELPTNRDIALHVDPELTISVVQNLVDNAVKYTDQGTVQVTVEERSESIVLHVRDNCAGISDEELAVVFEPFRRGILQHTKPGAGLGLAIAKRAAEAQGGAVGAESKEERGCHFWFELPRQVKRPAARQEERHESHPDH
jgi:signal transduction histidine kinase